MGINQTKVDGITIGRFTNVEVTEASTQDGFNIFFASDYRLTDEEMTTVMNGIEAEWQSLEHPATVNPETANYYICVSLGMDNPANVEIYLGVMAEATDGHFDGFAELPNAFTPREKFEFITIAREQMHGMLEAVFTNVYRALGSKAL